MPLLRAPPDHCHSFPRSLSLHADCPLIMSNMESSHYRKVPILTKVNFPKWEIQVISYLTGTADHVRVIEHHWGSNNTLVNPARPADTTAQAKWDASEWEALGVIMSTASDLHLEIIL